MSPGTTALLTGRGTDLAWDKEGQAHGGWNHWGCNHYWCLSRATYLSEASQSGIPINTSELHFALWLTRGLPGAAAGLAVAVVSLSGVVQPLKHRRHCSDYLITNSAQFTTGTTIKILAEGTFLKTLLLWKPHYRFKKECNFTEFWQTKNCFQYRTPSQ